MSNDNKEDNLKILEKLKEYFDSHPEIRFIQGLWNMNIIQRDNDSQIIDAFYEPSKITLTNLEKSLGN